MDNDDNIEPPIHTENFLSGGATTLTFIEDGANVVSSLLNLSGIPGNIVVPPDITILEYKSFLTSISDFIIDLYDKSCIPGTSNPIKCGLKSNSGHLNL